jgi:hypothetical protein
MFETDFAYVSWHRGGEFLGVSLGYDIGQLPDSSNVRIRIGSGGTMGYNVSGEPVVSDVRGVRVIAKERIISDESGRPAHATYVAQFELDGVLYEVVKEDMNDAASERMERKDSFALLVNEIIRRGTTEELKAKLDLFDDPEIPELRDDDYTFAQALADPDFGRFVPQNVPSGVDFTSARRSITFSGEAHSSLWLWWDGGARYTHDSLKWYVSTVQSHHLDTLVSPGEREKYDMSLYPVPWGFSVPEELHYYVQSPVFRADDMSLDVVKAREYNSEGTHVRCFAVLIDDTIIEVSTRGINADRVWDMLQPLLVQ